MDREHLAASEAGSPAKSDLKRSAEMLHIIQNLIPNRVANFQ